MFFFIVRICYIIIKDGLMAGCWTPRVWNGLPLMTLSLEQLGPKPTDDIVSRTAGF